MVASSIMLKPEGPVIAHVRNGQWNESDLPFRSDKLWSGADMIVNMYSFFLAIFGFDNWLLLLNWPVSEFEHIQESGWNPIKILIHVPWKSFGVKLETMLFIEKKVGQVLFQNIA